MSQQFTHVDSRGAARMVDVSGKQPTVRRATARAVVELGPTVASVMDDDAVPKGDVLAVARIAGIAAAKKTPELLPLAHVIGVHGTTVDIEREGEVLTITAECATADRTGVEMEALTAASVAALAVVDMVKGLDKGVRIAGVELIAKSGGKSGDWHRA
ncbi:cyclic pyranopterin monophosphate synthase MoaC [Aestuariimicrobium sp. p3-SID1156]|uniref:cyclic pyranopterin monophosphate synthase MoaC n=1 Tax=Aestuariimicrobium sp. p3-SID1156 TaxID=2916038 RepID=UPI00223BC123|nr:cyclic pyranopterin monophosphate synthase MoaC [Aestuariimicrobium sp. p3-SID1156]MCT1457962.1 cyclic pyranopterin monophosphate synthase MoaC [Aestuariimicrobium sp. p3-SID1156]